MQITHTQKRVCKDFEIKNLWEYHDLYVQSDRIVIIVSKCIWELLKYVSWKMWTWSCSFFNAPGLEWQAAFKKTKVKLDFLTNINISIRAGKCIWEGIYHSIYRCAKDSNKYMKDYDKNKDYINYKKLYL